MEVRRPVSGWWNDPGKQGRAVGVTGSNGNEEDVIPIQ